MSISQLNGAERLRASMAVAAGRANSLVAYSRASATVARRPDAVSISDAARSLVAAHKAVANTDEVVGEDRVAAIRSAIADGRYSIDTLALAKSMLRGLDR